MTLQDETVASPPSRPAAPGLESIPLPDVTRRSETRRRRQERRRRFRRRLALGALGLAVVVVLVSVAFGLRGDGGGDRAPSGSASAQQAAAAVPPVLLAQSDPSGRAVSLTVVAPALSGKGGTLVLLPPGTMTEMVSLGLQPVGKALQLGGPARLKATAENLLGVPVGEVVVLDDNGWAGLVAPAGPLTVRIPERVERVEARGTVEVLYEPGPRRVPPEEVGRLLSVKGQGNDLSRLARHQAFWDAWLARLDAAPASLPAQPPALRKALAALVADRDSVRTRVLPVQSMGTTDEDGELYQVEAEGMRSLVAAAFPGRPAASGARPRVQILNGTGALGLAQRVADRLVPAGVEVKLTGNAARLDHVETQVVFYDPADHGAAQRVQKALGVGKLVLSRNPLDVVDVTVIVGKDFRQE